MNLEKSYDFTVLVNDTERIVLEELGKRLDTAESERICICQDCVIDMATLALNSLKPMYHASLLGTMYAHAAESGAMREDVKKAVMKAVEKVKNNPSHA